MRQKLEKSKKFFTYCPHPVHSHMFTAIIENWTVTVAKTYFMCPLCVCRCLPNISAQLKFNINQ